MEEDKIKLEIQRLKFKSDYYKFEYSQVSTYYLGVIAFLVAIYIPIIISISPFYKIPTTLFLLILILSSHFIFKRILKKSENKIKELSKKIDGFYSEILS